MPFDDRFKVEVCLDMASSWALARSDSNCFLKGIKLCSAFVFVLTKVYNVNANIHIIFNTDL